jgi:hypothetical protein
MGSSGPARAGRGFRVGMPAEASPATARASVGPVLWSSISGGFMCHPRRRSEDGLLVHRWRCRKQTSAHPRLSGARRDLWDESGHTRSKGVIVSLDDGGKSALLHAPQEVSPELEDRQCLQMGHSLNEVSEHTLAGRCSRKPRRSRRACPLCTRAEATKRRPPVANGRELGGVRSMDSGAAHPPRARAVQKLRDGGLGARPTHRVGALRGPL